MRRSTPRLAGAALVTVAGLVLVGCSSKEASGELTIEPVVEINADGSEAGGGAAGEPADPAGDGSAECSGVAIAMTGPITGPNAALGAYVLNGVKLAVDQHNEANPNCQVEVKEFDSEGDPQKATQVAPSIVSDTSIIGIVGPMFSGESKATGPIYNQADLLMLSPSATNPGLTTNGWKNFVRGLGNDNSQGSAAANYLVSALNYEKVCVVQDDSEYGIGLATVVTETLGDKADSACAAKVKTGDKDFAAAVQLIKDAAPDAVYYAGYFPEAAPFVSQLRSSGVDADFVSDDGTNSADFITQAGDASKDAYLTCPCGPAPETFAEQYTAAYDSAPGVYAVEGYDLATIILGAIDSGITERADLVDYVTAYDGWGVAKHYKWDETGELGATTTWIYQVK